MDEVIREIHEGIDALGVKIRFLQFEAQREADLFTIFNGIMSEMIDDHRQEN